MQEGRSAPRRGHWHPATTRPIQWRYGKTGGLKGGLEVTQMCHLPSNNGWLIRCKHILHVKSVMRD